MNNSIKALLLSLFIAATAVITAACSNEDNGGISTTPVSGAVVTTTEATKRSEQTETPDETGAQGGGTTAAETRGESSDSLWAEAKYTEDAEAGEGDVTVKVKVIVNEKTVIITIHTNKTNLGDALVENGLVEGDKSEYGLYIKSVNGILADYDKDQSWWAISKDGEMLMTGADSTPIADGESYELTYTKG